MRARQTILDAMLRLGFRGSATYWQNRYRLGSDSGSGSHGALARFKADTLNRFVQENGIESVIEFGCGDGNQLSLGEYPRYLGLDVSKGAIDRCRERFADDRSKSFLWYDPAATINIENFLGADLTLSLDVIYHLVEDTVYDRYLCDLFGTSNRFVIVYSSDMTESSPVPHVRHRNFTRDVAARHRDFALQKTIENRYRQESFCSFYIFERAAPPRDGRG